MNRFDKAIELAAVAHFGQVRKGTAVPYVVHPYTVAMYLKGAGCREAVVTAGLLHDVIEDTDVTGEEIAALFGEEVAGLVRAVSEPEKSVPWEERKRHTLKHLETASEDVRILTCADKLHNLRTVIEAVEECGEDAWKRFKRGRTDQAWYYRSIAEILSPPGCQGLFAEYREAVEQCFGTAE